jgi:hypothetical protein
MAVVRHTVLHRTRGILRVGDLLDKGRVSVVLCDVISVAKEFMVRSMRDTLESNAKGMSATVCTCQPPEMNVGGARMYLHHASSKGC